MKKVVRLTERDLTRIVRRVIIESGYEERDYDYIYELLGEHGLFPNYEYFDEFEHSDYYDRYMTDDEYADAIYDFIQSREDSYENDEEEY